AGNGRRRAKLCPAALTGERLAACELTPCLGKSPSITSTWQRPHSARPPHTESTSTPRLRAACRSGVPKGKRPRFPDGVNTTHALGSLVRTVFASASLERGFSVMKDSGRACGAHPRAARVPRPRG